VRRCFKASLTEPSLPQERFEQIEAAAQFVGSLFIGLYVLDDTHELRQREIVGLDLVDLLVHKRHDTRQGDALAPEGAPTVTSDAPVELVGDHDDRILLQVVHREARLSHRHRAIGVVFRGEDSHPVRQ
jgi:hypothetical protein